MPQEILQGPGGDAALYAAHREGVPQYRWRHPLGNAGAVRHPFDNPLDPAGGDANTVLHRVMMRDQQAHPVGHRQHPALRVLARRPPLPLDGQASFLPQDVLFGQLCQFRDPQPGIEQDQNHLPLA